MYGRRLDMVKRLAASRFQVDENLNMIGAENIFRFPHIPTFSTGSLLEHQIEHTKRLNFVLKTRRFASDTSLPGRGKTYSGMECVKEQRLPVLVFCPKSGIDNWWKVSQMWGVPVITITNYDMARSSHSDTIVKWYDMRNGYTDDATVCPWISKEKIKSKASSKSLLATKDNIAFRWNLPYKCFIIFDEEHVGKNIHTQTFSFIKGAVQAAKRQGHKVLFLSATPIEKKVNLKSIMYFLGLISKPDMNNVNAFFRERIGISKIDSDNMTEVHQYLYNIDMKNPDKSTGRMSSMPDAKIPEGIVNDVRPIAFPMTEEITKRIAEKNKEILLLRERLRERVYDNTLGAINANRRFIETYKVDKAEELALAGLNGTFSIPEADPVTKLPTGRVFLKGFKRVSIFVNYKSTLHDLNHRLSSETGIINGKEQVLGPYISVLHGDQTKQESDQATLDYNSGKTKILISTIRKGGLSLSFHDTVGDKETLVIILPPTSATDILQVLGRSFRTSVKSSVTQVILFTLGDKIEESIRDALANKLDDILNFTTGTSCEFDLYDLIDEKIVKEIISV